MTENLTFYIDVLNQVFELEKKLGGQTDKRAIARPLERVKRLFEEQLPLTGPTGLFLHDPLGEKYTDTRTDVTATVAGEGAGTLRIVEVLKPIIYFRSLTVNQIVQRGVVIVE